jgi:hypothetical protein
VDGDPGTNTSALRRVSTVSRTVNSLLHEGRPVACCDALRCIKEPTALFTGQRHFATREPIFNGPAGLPWETMRICEVVRWCDSRVSLTQAQGEGSWIVR